MMVNGLVFANYLREWKKPLIKGIMLMIALYVLMNARSYKGIDATEQSDAILDPQNKKGKNKHGRGAPKGKRSGKKRYVLNSGDAAVEKFEDLYEEYEEPEKDDYIDEQYDSQKYIPKKGVKPEFSNKTARNMKPQTSAKDVKETLPPVRKDSEPTIRNKIRKSKFPITAKAGDVGSFLDSVKEIKAKSLKIQSFNTNALAAGVYKFCQIIDGKSVYRCTGTHVGNKMWVVLHCMSEDFSANIVHLIMHIVLTFPQKT
jgi:hypothetical protein